MIFEDIDVNFTNHMALCNHDIFSLWKTNRQLGRLGSFRFYQPNISYRLLLLLWVPILDNTARKMPIWGTQQSVLVPWCTLPMVISSVSVHSFL